MQQTAASGRRVEVVVKISRRLVVFDAKDIAAESRFWAGLLGGEVRPDRNWHSIVVDGDWVMGVQPLQTMCRRSGRQVFSSNRSTWTYMWTTSRKRIG